METLYLQGEQNVCLWLLVTHPSHSQDGKLEAQMKGSVRGRGRSQV